MRLERGAKSNCKVQGRETHILAVGVSIQWLNSSLSLYSAKVYQTATMHFSQLVLAATAIISTSLAQTPQGFSPAATQPLGVTFNQNDAVTPAGRMFLTTSTSSTIKSPQTHANISSHKTSTDSPCSSRSSCNSEIPHRHDRHRCQHEWHWHHRPTLAATRHDTECANSTSLSQRGQHYRCFHCRCISLSRTTTGPAASLCAGAVRAAKQFRCAGMLRGRDATERQIGLRYQPVRHRLRPTSSRGRQLRARREHPGRPGIHSATDGKQCQVSGRMCGDGRCSQRENGQEVGGGAVECLSGGLDSVFERWFWRW